MRITIKNEFKKKIGEALVKIRSQKKVSKMAIYNDTGIGLNALCSIEDGTGFVSLETYQRVFKSLGYEFEIRVEDRPEPDLVAVINELYWKNEDDWTMQKVFKLHPELGGAGAEKAAQILNMAECIDVQIAEAITWETRRKP
jgi:hypothetical protein